MSYTPKIYYSGNGKVTGARIAASGTAIFMQVYFKVSQSAATNNDVIPIAGIQFYTGGTYYNILNIQAKAPGYKLRAYYNDGSSNKYGTDSTRSCAADTWCRLRLWVNTSTRDGEAWIADQNGDSEEKFFDRTDMENSYAVGYVNLGTPSGASASGSVISSGNGSVYLWGLSLDDDTMPSACTQ